MRILYFHQHFATPNGSGGTRSYEFAQSLVKCGHKVTLVCGQHAQSGLTLPWDAQKQWSRGDVAGIDVIMLPLAYSNRHSIPWRAGAFLRFAWRSMRIALGFDCDVLFATSTPLTAALPGIAAKLAGRRQTFVFEVRDLWPDLPRALGMKNPFLLGGMAVLERMAYHCADACIGLSPGIVDGIRRRAPSGMPVVLLPNGCDLELFHPRFRGPLALPGIAPGDFVAGFTGAHGVANGLEAVLAAAGELKRRGRADIKVVFIGDGNRKDALVARAREERLDNCLFFPPIRKTEIVRITASLDCGLQILANVPAFYHGTSPNKFFDYIAAGLPVVVNYPGWLAGMIEENRCGVVVEPGEPSALADALCRLADNRALLPAMGTNARKLAETRFARQEIAGRFVALLESVAGKKST